MKFIKAYVQNFGTLSSFSHTFDGSIDSICLENGAGKSTFVAFIRAMLYGLSPNRGKDLMVNERAKYTPWQGGVFGGWLSFETNGKTYRIERTFAKKDTFALYDESTGKESADFSENVGFELLGIDENGFEKSLCFSERSQQLAVKVSSMQGKLVQMQDFSDFEDALKTLDNRRKFYKLTGNRGAIAQTEADLFAKEAELERAKGASALYLVKHQQIETLKQERPAIQKQYEECEKALEAMQASKADALIHSQWKALKKEAEEKRQELNAANAMPLPDKDTLKSAESACRFLIDHPAPAKVEEAPKKQSKLPSLILFAAAVALGIGGIFFAPAFAFCALALLLAILAPWNKKPSIAPIALDPFAEQRENAQADVAAFLADFPAAEGAETLWDVMAHLQSFDAAYERLNALKNAKETTENALQIFEHTHPNAFRETVFNTQDEQILRAEKARLQGILYGYTDRLLALERETAQCKAQAERATLLVQELEELKERLPRLQESLYAIEKAKEYLASAKENLSSEYLGQVQSRFAEYVAALSSIDPEIAQGEYLLSADFEVQLLLEGASRTKVSMSRGGKDLLALCLQLALSDALFEDPLPPLLLDDPFIAFDDAKLQNAFALLASLSKKRQIVYFTCHSTRSLA